LKESAMMTETDNLFQSGRRYQHRCFSYPLLFLLLVALAGLSGDWSDAALGQTVPGGTIPPGGTLPAPPTPTPGAALVRVLHLAPFDSDLANTAVDICTQTGDPVAGLTDLVYLAQSGYITLPPGQYDWTVSTPGCGIVALDLPAFALQPGMVLTLLVVGGGNQPLSSVLLVDRAGQSYLYLPIVAKV
jgi:hypothetical protein